MNNVDNFLPAEQFTVDYLMPPMDEASRLLVACRPGDFSASAIARAVEDTNAHLVNLNVTPHRLDDGRLTVELRTNHSNSSAAARSLERYGYEVLALNSSAQACADDHLRARANELLHLLEI